MNQGKKWCFLGGDHSTPLGYYQALATKYDNFGILHLDAHMDLRIAYEGFYSHASIMYNTLQIPQVSKIVQVGIRDFCEQEVEVALKDRVLVHTDMDLKQEAFEGKTWQQQCDHIIASLPEKVCISLILTECILGIVQTQELQFQADFHLSKPLICSVV